MTGLAALLIVAAGAIIRSERRRNQRLRDQLLAASERANHELDGAELERRVLAHRRQQGRS